MRRDQLAATGFALRGEETKGEGCGRCVRDRLASLVLVLDVAGNGVNVLSALTGARVEQAQQPFEQFQGARRATANMQIDRHNVRDTACYCIASGKYAAVGCTVADRDHPFGIGRGVIGAL
jgi:hypothetical protein